MTQYPDSDEFRIARALSIEAYARIESSFTVLLATLLDTKHDIASIIFFEIVNTRARNKIIQSLITRVHGERFNTYWNGQKGQPDKPNKPGLFSLIQQIDEERNQIVHWHPTGNSSSTGEKWEDLRPAYYWARKPNVGPINTSALNRFIQKANFVYRSVDAFWRFIKKPMFFSEVERDAWSHIFEQPVLYPPPSEHPLFHLTKED
jgi:hypothetical protein